MKSKNINPKLESLHFLGASDRSLYNTQTLNHSSRHKN